LFRRPERLGSPGHDSLLEETERFRDTSRVRPLFFEA
jgi:hypothetical protein